MNKKNKYILIISICGFAGLSTGLLMNKFNNDALSKLNDEQFERYKDYFLHTNSGKVIRTKTTKNPIDVVLHDLSESEKQHIIEGVNKLDDISENINYKIYDSADYESNSNQRIDIRLVDDINGNAIGQARIYSNDETGEIIYPVQINIERKYDDEYFVFNKDKSMLTTIVQHELGHTLGLKDIYDNNQKKETLMYAFTDRFSLNDYTERDKKLIQSCYDNINYEYDITINNSEYNVEVKQPDYMAYKIYNEDIDTLIDD